MEDGMKTRPGQVFTKADGEKVILGHCSECRDGEHEDFCDDVRMTIIRDPDTKKLVYRGFLCSLHRDARDADGYDLIVKHRKQIPQHQ